MVADALVDVRLKGVLVIRHFFLRRTGAVVEVQGACVAPRWRAVLLCCGRAGGVQNTCCRAVGLACYCSDATRLAYQYDRSKRVKNARSAGKLLRERVLQADLAVPKTDLAACKTLASTECNAAV